jgi:hypothetical protein
MPGILDEYLTDVELAAELKNTPRTLASWRAQGIGPAWIRVGKKPLYRRAGIQVWLETLEHQPVRQRSAGSLRSLHRTSTA